MTWGKDGKSHCGDETNDGVFDFEPDPERNSKIDPVPWPLVEDEAEKAVKGDHPGDLVEGHGLVQPVGAKEIRRCKRNEQRDCLQPQRAAEAADIEAGAGNHETAEQGGEQAEGPRTDPEKSGL